MSCIITLVLPEGGRGRRGGEGRGGEGRGGEGRRGEERRGGEGDDRERGRGKGW